MKELTKLKLVFFALMLPGVLFAQEKEKLEKERMKIIREIEKTDSYLKSAQKEKDRTLKDLKVLESQISNRKKLVSTVEEELNLADKTLVKNQQKRDSINKRYEEVNKQYLSLLRYNYLQELSNQKLSFLLSSESLNVFLLRYRYIKQFEAYQKQKKEELLRIRTRLVHSDEIIKTEKEKKQALLSIEKTQIEQIRSEQTGKESILKELSGKESQLKAELNEKKKEREKLNKAIELVILAQLKEANERKNAAANEKAKTVKSGFSNQKGKLIWPVKDGIISTRFGKQPHPTLKGISIESNGIDIDCPGPRDVFAAYEGTIVGIVKVIGSENMVIINHGQYHTVYSNLKEVSVKKGDAVKTGDKIGRIASDSDVRSELHFEVWDGKNKVNPAAWLR